MRKKLKSILFLIILIAILIIPYFVFAQSALQKLEAVQKNSGYISATPYSAAEIAGTVVKAFLSILGIIFVVLMLYGGYNWMTAMGENAKVDKAKDTIKSAVIGLIITAGAYAIADFVMWNLGG